MPPPLAIWIQRSISRGVVTTSLSNTDIYGTAVVIQPDGKILAGGHSDSDKLTVIRYNDDGSLDTAFGTSGIATAPVGSIDLNDAQNEEQF